MLDEEKKAIDYYTINEYSFGFEIDCDIESFKKAIGIEETDEDTFEKHQIRFKTLLNLIEKQQKEIDELQSYIKEYLIPKSTINLLYVSKDKVRKYIKENKRIYEMKTPNRNRVIYKDCVLLTKEVKEFLEE